MRALWAFSACLGLAYPFGAIPAQSGADTLAIDLAVARAMVGHQNSKGQISIDPVEGAEDRAPSDYTAGNLHSASHTNALAKSISGSVRRYSDVTKCASGRTQCALTRVIAHLILSAPKIRGDTASVTATIYQNAPGKRQLIDYETVIFRLFRTTRGWAVVKEDQLGIS